MGIVVGDILKCMMDSMVGVTLNKIYEVGQYVVWIIHDIVQGGFYVVIFYTPNNLVMGSSRTFL